VSKSKIVSITGMNCPKCREGFLFHQPYSLANAYKMKSSCEVCGQKYEPEPGFYYGAMFVSYILTGWFFIAVGLTLTFALGWSVTMTLVTLAIITVLLHNLIYRFSRSVWIHLFVRYDPQTSIRILKS
jgi:uncharacterized protein (DUF983 family)